MTTTPQGTEVKGEQRQVRLAGERERSDFSLDRMTEPDALALEIVEDLESADSSG